MVNQVIAAVRYALLSLLLWGSHDILFSDDHWTRKRSECWPKSREVWDKERFCRSPDPRLPSFRPRFVLWLFCTHLTTKKIVVPIQRAPGYCSESYFVTLPLWYLVTSFWIYIAWKIYFVKKEAILDFTSFKRDCSGNRRIKWVPSGYLWQRQRIQFTWRRFSILNISLPV